MEQEQNCSLHICNTESRTHPAAKDTPSCSVLLHSAFGFGTTYLYSACNAVAEIKCMRGGCA